MSTVLVRYRIARTGQPVPSDTPAPPDYVPWPHAPITWTRIEGDYGPGIVRPRDSITTRADEHGEGAVYLAPGRYRITLPSRDTRDVTVSPGLGTVDLSALLAGGIEPDDPAYPTLAAYVDERVEASIADQLERIDAAVETAEDSASAAQTARQGAEAAQAEAESARDAAVSARQAAESARDDAQGYATAAGAARDEAVEAAGTASDAASTATSARDDALEAVGTATEAAGSASDSASAAASSALAAAQSAADAAQARDAAQGYATAAQGYATTASEAAEDAETARDAVLNLVPDPSEEPDGRVLVTRGGALKYAPDLAAAVAVAGASPALVTIYETGRRAVTSATSAYGRQTDSGHIWEAVPGSAASPTLAYHPQGYLLAGSTPSGSYPELHESGVSLVGSGVLGTYRAVSMVGYSSAANHLHRHIVVGWEDADNYIAIQVELYRIRAILRLGGQTQVLGEWGNLNQGDAPHLNVWHIRGLIQRSHVNYGSAAVMVYYRGAEVIRAPVDTVPISDGAPVGIAAGASTRIYSLTAWSLTP